MFSVLFEVHPRGSQWNAYLGYAKMLRPDLEQIDGFVDNIRYASLTRPGWILSLSGWRDEKALVRWRTRAQHHEVQEKGRDEVLADYHLRVGQVTVDSRLPDGCELLEQRLDETQTGSATHALLIDAAFPAAEVEEGRADAVAHRLGLVPDAPGLVEWDVFDAVLTPGAAILLLTWRDQASADAFRDRAQIRDARVRQVRIVRDYGMYDRQENPQYYPEVERVS
jgi:heme-degrading monooxygenase HmoA